MKIKILKKCQGLRGVFRPGFIVDVPVEFARQYINQGFAVEVPAENRQTKIVVPEKVKAPKFPKDRMDYTLPKKKRKSKKSK